MRQIRFLCAVLAVSVLSLTGCADIKNLSEEQENEIAEYAAGVLLQNSDKYPYRLIAKEEKEVETIKEAVRAIRNVRTSMNVPPSRKAKVFVVTEDADLTDIFENSRVFFSTLASASEVVIQKDKTGIGEDAVSAVIPKAAIYMPFAELVDIEKETERLKKEEERLTKELARVNGMLANEKFVSKAPQAKIDEEKAKLQKYTEMMEQVKTRLAQLGK